MKIIITGSRGQLGTDLVSYLSRFHEVNGVGRKEFDISSLESTLNYIVRGRPDVIIHSAAFTDVDACERNPEKAFKINSIGTRNVAIAARKVGAKMVYISTDYVFGESNAGSSREMDEPNPVSVYGKSKLLGENFVREQHHDYFICRIAWLYGKAGNNFVQTMLKLATEKKEIRVVDDQMGSPTWTMSVARQLEELINTEKFGVYHCTSKGKCSWYEFALKIFKNVGYEVSHKKGESELILLTSTPDGFQHNIKKNFRLLDLIKLVPISSQDLDRPAPRPDNSVLENFMLRLEGLEKMPHWQDSLEEFIKTGF